VLSRVRTHEQRYQSKCASSPNHSAVRTGNTELSISARIASLLLGCVCLFAFAPDTAAQGPPLVLLSEPSSTRAVAFDSIAFTREPFPLDSLISWSPDRRTRIVLFALNLQLPASEDPADVAADAEDAFHQHHRLRVEDIGPVPGEEWLNAVTLRLSDDLIDVGDVLVRLSYQGRTSNRVRIGIGHIGGGPTDDPGARPTSPYFLRGRVTADGLAVPGVPVTLKGSTGIFDAVSNADGDYQILAVGGDYLLSVSQPFYNFNPSSKSLENLSQTTEGLDDNGQAIANLEMTLTSNEFATRKATTDSAGSFSFADVPAGLACTIAPGNHNIFAFAPQTIEQLDEPPTLVFSGVRRAYTISGHVKSAGAALADAVITVHETGITTVSDAYGNYSFSGVTAGRDYTVLVAAQDYAFQPASIALPQLDGNRQVDLEGTPHVFLTGRVVDENGRGVFGIKVDITGTQNGVAVTAADGSYSFLVTSFGNYLLTPSKEQDYYTLTPNTATLTAAKNSRVANFNASLNTSVSPSYVLEFDGAPKTVDYSMTLPGPDYNLFWPDGENFGHFFWEFWAMPGDNAAGTYMISDGYGGAHAILFGVSTFGGREPGRYQLFGNIWNGKFLTPFSSDEGPAPYEWGHFAVGWDGVNIVTYFNGVPVGKTPFVGPRITPGGIQGCGRLLIGGSDHSNFRGRIAQVRGFERNNPREADDNGGLGTFKPQTVFAVDGNLLSYFFRPANDIADLSLNGQYGRQHTGLLRSTVNGVLYPCEGCPLPQFVVDPTAPDFAHPNHPGTPPAPFDTPASVPDSALIFDSFSRRNSTYALNGLGGLNTTEGGTAGTRTWQTNQAPGQPQPFGILNGRAVLLANAKAITWINVPAANTNLDIRVDRHAGVWGTGLNTGISFRITDSNNYFFAYTKDNVDPSQPELLTVGNYLGGTRTDLATGISLPASWTTLRVVTTAAGTINVYADNTLLYSLTDNALTNSVGAGLYNDAAGLALTNRWDNFRVFSVP
jgi:carboxypeptidase family protein/concanavalin A-like lectin/glucanase superfamily protein